MTSEVVDQFSPLAEELAARLPSGWDLKNLGALCEKPQYGWTTKANKEGRGVKFLRTTDITPGFVEWSTVPYCSEEPNDLEKYLIRDGDLLISRAGSVGVSHLVSKPEPAVFASYLIRFRPKVGVSAKYLRYYLQSPMYWRAIGAGKLGIAVQNVNATTLSQIPVPVAPEPVQREIVAELEKQFSRLDDAVTNLMRVKSNLKRYRTSVLKFLFSGGSMSEELPPGWQWTTIGEQFRVEVGATPSRKHSGYWGGAIPWVSSGEVQFKRVKRTVETITEEGLRNSSTRLNPAGSVLLGMIGQGRTRGQAAILDIEAANNQNCAAIWVSKTETPPEFVYYWFMSQYEATRRVGSGNNQQALNKSLVQHLPMPWPGSIAEQRRLVAQVEERLQVVEELEVQVRANLARSQYLRRTSLQRAFVQCAEAGL